MKEIFDQCNIRYLWHFTDAANIDSIKEHNGLWAWAELQKKGIKVLRPSGNDWSRYVDNVKGLDNYVHLAFNCKHPLAWIVQDNQTVPNLRWLRIDVTVIGIDDVRFARGVANKGGIELLDAEQAVKQFDETQLDALLARKHVGDKEAWKDAQKAEILVPRHVPLNYIEFPS